jgi:RNA polymerase sigma-70 factor (ECF subfamily)
MDISVLERARAGDVDALDVLVRTYHDRVYRFGLRACRNAFDADDAVQEAFIKLARRPDVVRDPGALSWLMTVVRNACARMLRPFSGGRHATAAIADAGQLPDEGLSPEAAIERWQLVHAVHEAIARLEPLYREVIILRDLEGLTGEQVSEMLDVPQATMKTRLHRARQMLREHIEMAGLRDETVSSWPGGSR